VLLHEIESQFPDLSFHGGAFKTIRLSKIMSKRVMVLLYICV